MTLCSFSAHFLLSIILPKAKLLFCLFSFPRMYLVPHHHHETSRLKSFYLCVFVSRLMTVCLLVSLLRKGSPLRAHNDLLSTRSAAALKSLGCCLSALEQRVPFATGATPHICSPLTIPFKSLSLALLP